MMKTLKTTYKITIQDAPPSLNKLMSLHWAAASRLKSRFIMAVVAAMKESQLPHSFQSPPKKVRLTFVIHQPGRGRSIDPDNYLKALLDSLKTAGVIHDDSAKWCLWERPEIKRSKERKTEVLITLEDWI